MTDQEQIEQFIRDHGVTRCPAALGVVCSAMLSDEDRAAHMARWDGKDYLDHMHDVNRAKIGQRNTRIARKRRKAADLARKNPVAP